MKLYMFQTVPLSIIRSCSLCNQQWYMSYRFVDSLRAGSGWNCNGSSILILNNSWWWTEELSETCRVSFQNKFEKLLHLVGFITRKFVMMQGCMNVKLKLWYHLKRETRPWTIASSLQHDCWASGNVCTEVPKVWVMGMHSHKVDVHCL